MFTKKKLLVLKLKRNGKKKNRCKVLLLQHIIIVIEITLCTFFSSVLSVLVSTPSQKM